MNPVSERQEVIDRYYVQHGPCCAGCDWWHHESSLIGECRASAPVKANERYAILGMESCSLALGAGHVLTKRDHHCGSFKDEFDWSSLPLTYRKKIGKL